MKNTPEQNTFAGRTGKFLPEAAAFTPSELDTDAQSGEAASRVTVIPPRGEWSLPGMLYSESAGALDDAPPPAGQLMLERLTHLSSLIIREVHTLRQTTARELDVMLRPDGQTEISLYVRWHEGQLLAQARCRRGDFVALRDGWSELQETLTHHDVRLAELAPPQTNGHSAKSHHSGSSRRDSDQSASREDVLSEPQTASKGTGRIHRRHSSQPRNLTRGSRHRLESWA